MTKLNETQNQINLIKVLSNVEFAIVYTDRISVTSNTSLYLINK